MRHSVQKGTPIHICIHRVAAPGRGLRPKDVQYICYIRRVFDWFCPAAKMTNSLLKVSISGNFQYQKLRTLG